MIQGKGIYIWQLPRCDNGDMGITVDTLKRAGMTHVIPKIADGNYAYTRNEPYLRNLIELCHRAGIKVIPFHFVYGSYPVAEAERAVVELKKYPYDGFVINAEGAYKALSNPSQAARLYCDALRSKLPDMMLALSTYRYPSLHRAFPFATFLEYCDVNMPQVYWMMANGTVPAQLSRTIKEYEAFPQKPIVPTGAAFKEHGWTAIPADQKVFVDEVKKHGLAGCNFWEYYEAFNLQPALGQAIIEAQWDVETEPIEPEPEPPGLFWAVCVARYALTIRSQPVYDQTGGNIVGYLEADQKRLVYAQSGIWWQIGEGEWVSSNYMQRLTDPVIPEPLTLEERLEQVEKRLERVEGAVFG